MGIIILFRKFRRKEILSFWQHLVVFFTIGGVLMSLTASAQSKVSVTYTPSLSVFCNPERGIFTHTNNFDSSNNYVLTSELLRGFREDGISLVFCAFVMDEYRDCLIPDSYLDRIRAALAMLRSEGLKAVVRFSYSFSQDNHPWDIPWTLTRQHIEQLRPLLRENVDVIAVLEAGFIGVWGEWFYTENYVYEPSTKAEYAPRREVLNALLDALPSTRFVDVRYPNAKLMTLGIGISDTVTSATAFDGSPRSRVGFHNDAFLAARNDWGSFSDEQDDRSYWMQETRFVPMGGETAAMSSYCNSANAAKQLENYHWSYLNRDFHPDVIAMWKEDGFYSTVERRLGYRLLLTEGTFTSSAQAGELYTVNLTIRNVGWAAPYNPRMVELVWENVACPRCRFVLPATYDPRRWEAGTDQLLSMHMVLPKEMPEGDYRICLRMADPTPSLYARSEYAIRLANEGVWDETSGMNVLYLTHVSSGMRKESACGTRLHSSALIKSLWAGSERDVSLPSHFFAEAQVGDSLQFVVACGDCHVVMLPINGPLLRKLQNRGLSWMPSDGGWVQAVNLVEPDHQHAPRRRLLGR